MERSQSQSVLAENVPSRKRLFRKLLTSCVPGVGSQLPHKTKRLLLIAAEPSAKSAAIKPQRLGNRPTATSCTFAKLAVTIELIEMALLNDSAPCTCRGEHLLSLIGGHIHDSRCFWIFGRSVVDPRGPADTLSGVYDHRCEARDWWATTQKSSCTSLSIRKGWAATKQICGDSSDYMESMREAGRTSNCLSIEAAQHSRARPSCACESAVRKRHRLTRSAIPKVRRYFINPSLRYNPLRNNRQLPHQFQHRPGKATARPGLRS